MTIFKTSILSLFVPLVLFSCEPKKKTASTETTQQSSYELWYDLQNPTQRLTMPNSLTEISGLSFYKNNQLACVNDEDGEVFIYDFKKEKIIEKIPFGKKGDYEGVEVIGNEIFILKSNGKIKSFKVGEAFEREIDCSDSDVIEFEGLSYDPTTKCLLLAAKERVKDKDDKKMIYAYDFKKQTMFKNIAIPEDAVIGEDGKKLFRPSGIAVHPLTGEVFIVASQGKKLLILSKDGAKEALVSLDATLFRQPEGICFTPNGDLFIASEGAGADGYILKFARKK